MHERKMCPIQLSQINIFLLIYTIYWVFRCWQLDAEESLKAESISLRLKILVSNKEPDSISLLR